MAGDEQRWRTSHSGECRISVTTTYLSQEVNFQWTVVNWKNSPECLKNKIDNKESKLFSPVFPNANGSTWQLHVVFPEKEANSKQTICFKCHCLKPLPYDAQKECPLVLGTLKLLDEAEGKDVVCYTLKDGCKISNAPVFDTEAKDISAVPDKMHLVANLSIVGLEPLTEAQYQTSFQSTDHRWLAKFLAFLWADEDFADFTIEVEEQKFPAHRLVLASRSPVLRSLLLTDMREKREGKIVLSDVSASGWRIFQKYLYTNAFSFPKDGDVTELLEVLMLSDKYDVHSLRNVVEGEVISRMSADNIVEVLEASVKFGLFDLKEAGVDFLKRKWATLRTSRKMMRWLSGDCELAQTMFEKLCFSIV